MQQLIDSVTIIDCVTPTAGAAGSTDINGSVIDMALGQGALIVVRFGVITAGAATSIKAQHGDASDLSDAADLLGTGQTIADTDDGKIFYIDLSKPIKRYARLVVKRATQNAVVADAIALVYNAKNRPTVQPTGVAGETHVGEQAGTA